MQRQVTAIAIGLMRTSTHPEASRAMEGKTMTQAEFDLPETLLDVIKEDHEYSIFLLQGERLILFPA